MEELYQSGQLGFTAFFLNHPNRVIISIRVELHQDFSHQSNSGAARLIVQRQSIELFYTFLNQAGIAEATAPGSRVFPSRKPFLDNLIPTPIKLHRGAFHQLVGAYPQKHGLQHIAQANSLQNPVDFRPRQLESRIFFNALYRGRNHRHLRISGIAQPFT